MKRILKFSTLAIFAILFSLAPFCPNVRAQTPVTKNQTDEKEKQEVEKFVNLFLQSLEESKDINQVPKRFLVSDFKARIVQHKDWFDDFYQISSQLSDGERYEFVESMLNFSYLSVMANNGKCCADGEVKDFYPPEVFALMKKSKIINSLFGEGDFKISNVEELRSLIIDIKPIVETQRQFLNKQSPEWKNTYAQNIAKTREKFDSYLSEICSGEDCEGLPEKTRIFRVAVFPWYLYITREQGELKILGIYPYTE